MKIGSLFCRIHCRFVYFFPLLHLYRVFL